MSSKQTSRSISQITSSKTISNKSKKASNKKVQNMANISVKICIYTVFIALLIILSVKGYKFGKSVFSEKGYDEKPGTDVTITVDSGEGIMSVGSKLVDNGVIKDRLVFYVQTILYEGKFKAGTYTVNTSDSPEEIINILSAEKSTGEE